VSGLTTDLLRTFVFTWLLLTVPVVCHHETAVVVLGGLTANHTHQPAGGAVAHTHQSGGGAVAHVHPSVGADPAGALPVATDPAPGDPRPSGPEWCAHYPTAVTAGVPSGLDSLALFEVVSLPAPRPGATLALHAVAGASTTDAPLAPPPRLLV
jgi:hypothetical protein